MTVTIDMILSAVAALAASGGAFALWAIKRWIDRLDGRLDQISQSIGDLKTKAAVSQERHDSLIGGIDHLRRTCQDNAGQIAVLTGSLTKLWSTLEAQRILTGRASDLRDAK